MYARRAAQPSSPTSWDTTFESRSRLQEHVSLWRLRTGLDARYRAMAPALTHGSRVLDVGCGLGTWARFLEERQHLVWGVDLSVRLLA
jgi:ubiquinone/menaquinone biosynthesis C-methylase UbiE